LSNETAQRSGVFTTKPKANLFMLSSRLLPWDYAVRNLMRRPTRTALTLGALTVVVLLILVVVGFIRGLESSLAVSGDSSAVLVYSVTAESNIENSAIAARTPALLMASIPGIQKRYSQSYVSPELYFGTRMKTAENDKGGLGLVRGVTNAATMVRRRVRLIEGQWPSDGEVIVGRLVASKLGCRAGSLKMGSEIEFENKRWRISGTFVAGGSAFESEVWCPLPDLQNVLKRQDLSLVAILLQPDFDAAEVDLFCKQRTDLELQSIVETEYYATLQKHYTPMRLLAWFVVLLVSGAGIFAGLNVMYGAVAGRVRELSTLQAIGFRRRAILISLIQEGMLLSAAGTLLAAVIAIPTINGLAIRFTMGAFMLRIDSIALMWGGGIGMLLGLLGAIPPAIKVLKGPVAQGLKAI
jgi:putative ABC transport system permease protein